MQPEKDMGYGILVSSWSTAELQIWVALVQNSFNMRKIETWNLWICVKYDNISNVTVSLNVDVVHVLSLDDLSCVWSLYEFWVKIFVNQKSHKLLLPLVKDGDDRNVSENYS